MSTPEVQVISTLSAAAALRDEWDELAVACSAPPFLFPDIAISWWRHLGRGRLHLIVVRVEGTIVGLAPLHLRRPVGVATLRFIGHGAGVVGRLLLRPGHEDQAERLWDAAAEAAKVLDLIDHHGHAEDVSPSCSSSWVLDQAEHDSCPLIELAGFDSVEDLLAGSGRRKLRQNIARADRDAASSGHEVTTVVLTDRAEILAVMDELHAVHDAAEAAHQRVHFLEGERGEFTREIVDLMARQQRAAICIVRVDGEAVAFHIAFRTGRTVVAWLARYAPAGADYSPGHLMLRSVVDWAIGEGATELDLQLGTDAYKQRWATTSYPTIRILGSERSRPWVAPATVAASDRLFAIKHALREVVAARSLESISIKRSRSAESTPGG